MAEGLSKMLSKMSARFWLAVFMFVQRRRWGLRSRSWCANRHTVRRVVGPLEVTTVVRDARMPDGYSREELVELLRLVREHERRQDWRVPEPGGAAVVKDDVGIRGSPKEEAQWLLAEFRSSREEKRMAGTFLFDEKTRIGKQALLELVEHVMGKVRLADDQRAREASRPGVLLHMLQDEIEGDPTLELVIGPRMIERGTIVFAIRRGRAPETCLQDGSVLEGVARALAEIMAGRARHG